MPICLPQQCLALVNGLPPPGDPLFRESPGWWVRLHSVGHRHRTCSHVFVPENLEGFRKLFYAYMSTLKQAQAQGIIGSLWNHDGI